MTDYKKEILVSNYFEIYDFYKKKLGNNVIILMQVGSFHECYGTDIDGPNMKEIAEKLNFIVTKKNKNKELNKSNPYMIGAPSYGVEDIIEKLINNNYAIIRIDQTTEPPKPKREIVGIYTPATYVERTNNNITNLVSIFFDIVKKKNNILLCAGLSVYDLSTGKGNLFEIANKEDDDNYCLDNVVHFLEKYPPKEIILEYGDNYKKYIDENKSIYNLTTSDILQYIGVSDINLYSSRNLSILKKVNYQQNLLEKIFNHNSKINIIEDLELQYYHFCRISLVILIDFINNNNKHLLEKIERPIWYLKKDTLFLGNKAIDQLDVFNKKKCLFDIINNTRTPLGVRLLRENLNNPICDINLLNNRYEMIELIINNNLNDKVKDYFTNIYDINKLLRRIILNNINPFELYNLYISLKNSYKILNILKDYNSFEINNPNSKMILKNINTFLNFLEEKFDLNYILNINFCNYKEETKNYILNNNKLNEIERLINSGTNFMKYLVKELEKHVEDKKFMNKNNDLINLKFNERDGYYLLITKRRSKKLIEKLIKIKEIIVGGRKIKYEDLKFQDLPKSNNVKIFCNEIKSISLNVIELKYKLAKEIKLEFYKILNNIYDKYNKDIKFISDKISLIDFLFSGAITASKHGYNKPKINDIKYGNSYFNVTQMRHPIVEVINDNNEYKPHNINIGLDYNGILLYGINSSGKSTLMKSIGLNIILAQIGYYVAATEFEYYPYSTLMTRICGNDNIFKGMSSFMVEMMELMAILKRNDSNTLVLGDEICRGTEEKSANIIVTYMLERLSSMNTSFITATHLHQIAEMSSVKKLDNVKPMHLKVEYDNDSDKLIYSRILCDGQGDKYYGVQVAKYLMRSDIFNKRTKELEEEYENIGIKESKYNSNNIMEYCEICNIDKELETHHINFQKNFVNKILIDKPHIKKNSNYNLVTLCRYCHDNVDNGKIIIDGWCETTNGRELKYKKNQNKIKKKKYDDVCIKIINEIKKLNLSLEKSKELLKESHNINISTGTISKIWNNIYY